jgi:hypothetical protein
MAKRIPALKFLAAVEILMLARRHAGYLSPPERRRLGALVANGFRERQVTPEQREEILGLLRKLEPRAFAGNSADALSPVPLPRLLREGRRKKRA